MCVLILFMYKAKEFLKNHRIRGGAVYLVTILTLYTVSFIRFIGFGQYTTILSLSHPHTQIHSMSRHDTFSLFLSFIVKSAGDAEKKTLNRAR